MPDEILVARNVDELNDCRITILVSERACTSKHRLSPPQRERDTRADRRKTVSLCKPPRFGASSRLHLGKLCVRQARTSTAAVQEIARTRLAVLTSHNFG